MRASLLLAPILIMTACLVDVDLSGKACDGQRDCSDGYFCSSEVCLPDATLGVEGGRCRDDNTCADGLDCLSDRCVRDDIASGDAGQSDAGQSDAGQPDAGQSDAGHSDSGQSDSGTVDAGQSDSGTVDAGQSDAGAVDAGAVDAGQSDAGAVDAGAVDAGAVDAGQADAGVVDAGLDAGAIDGGVDSGPASQLFVVDTDEDSADANLDGVCADSNGNCSLRAAVREANATVAHDTIQIPASYISLGSTLTVEQDLMIIGASRSETYLDGQDARRLIDVKATATTFELRDLTLKHGFALTESGGALRSHAEVVVLKRVAVSDSTVGQHPAGSSLYGGGALLEDFSSATISGCEFVENSVIGDQAGGGLALRNGGDALVEDSLFENNQAGQYGAGLYAETTSLIVRRSLFHGNNAGTSGAIDINCATAGPVTIQNSTFSANTAGSRGAAIFSCDDDVILRSNTFFENLPITLTADDAIFHLKGNAMVAPPGLPMCQTIGSGGYSSNGDNFFSHQMTACDGTLDRSDVEQDPQLLPLGYNGGPTQTHALGGLSPARDHMPQEDCLQLDQRGFTRVPGSCDTGAWDHEVQ